MVVHQRGWTYKVTGGKRHSIYRFGGAWCYPEYPDESGMVDVQLRRILGYEG